MRRPRAGRAPPYVEVLTEALASSIFSPGDRSDDLGTIEQASLLLGRQPVLDVLVLEDLVERAAAVVLANHVACDVVFGGALLEQEREEILEYGHATRLYPGG